MLTRGRKRLGQKQILVRYYPDDEYLATRPLHVARWSGKHPSSPDVGIDDAHIVQLEQITHHDQTFDDRINTVGQV